MKGKNEMKQLHEQPTKGHLCKNLVQKCVVVKMYFQDAEALQEPLK